VRNHVRLQDMTYDDLSLVGRPSIPLSLILFGEFLINFHNATCDTRLRGNLTRIIFQIRTSLALLYGRLLTALQSVSRGQCTKGHQSRLKGNAVFLLILDSVGNSELLLILAAALIFFGPRRLPQLGRQLGKSLHEFRRASEDFKRTWEREVNLEDRGTEPPAENSILDRAAESIRTAREATSLDSNPQEPAASVIAPSVRAVDPSLVQPRDAPLGGAAPGDQSNRQPDSKHDWL
jgi:TatA/E family protein of Tat protein translocase